jgi:hypothetical protein
MLVLGLLLLLAGVLGLLAGLFTARGTAEMLGLDVDAVELFLVGVACGVAILVGCSILTLGTKRSLRRRRERRRVNRSSAQPEPGTTAPGEGGGAADGRHVARDPRTP